MSEASWFFGRSAGTAGRRNTYWLVEERGCGGLEVPISVLAAGLRVLPVFGFEEEAGLFLRLAFRGGRWVRRIGTGELVSLLRGPLGGVEFVAPRPFVGRQGRYARRVDEPEQAGVPGLPAQDGDTGRNALARPNAGPVSGSPN